MRPIVHLEAKDSTLIIRIEGQVIIEEEEKTIEDHIDIMTMKDSIMRDQP